MNAALLFLAGICGGLTGSIAGLASVATYPALLAVGLPPVTANVTNTVAVVFNGIGSVLGSRPELKGQGAWLLRVGPLAALGGAAGALLLLYTPPEGFERSVPILLGASALAILLPRRQRPPDDKPRRRRRVLILEGLAVLAITGYAGYFGAAAGVLLLALLLRAGGATLAHANASKNALMGIANLVAAILFAVLAPVAWAAVLPLGLGCLLGSRLGPVVVRHAPATPMRLLIGAAGLAVAIKIGIDTY
ncbi:UPF0721 transmembrane protein [Mycolicibacterium chitae]|uniref:Probable membrane transporter protein n=1 Tax=Mycolicibacterium chitae TaxID=1792 RepID=A0A3S4RH67_MYCCI|nr:sulfite exporter TauE/SafE family protein [Mycolicibacterium chitae]MCV7109130.1 sulfite exporter TauE/SafE family protein [Mycolicibacterium chitae]BBZ01494.1 UPF0721 transmembrane protein [Mycolicibacterium chitae]VEG50330.1 putative permease [Mycolicibacterium chitae]